jgi:hypothetical protein
MFCYIIFKMSRKKIYYPSISILLLILSLSCSSSRKLSKTKIELTETVEKYWKALISHDHVTIKKLRQETNGYSHDFIFNSGFDLDITSFKVENISFNDDYDKAKVTVSYNYRIPVVPDEFHNTQESEWICMNGKWFFKAPLTNSETP